MSTSENRRYHAAGHLAAAHHLASIGQIEPARQVLGIVKQWFLVPHVQSPPSLRATLDDAIADPARNLANIEALERMLTHDANTNLEDAGIMIGNGA